MIKSGLRTQAVSHSLYVGRSGEEDSGIIFMNSNTSLPTLASTDRAIGFQSATLKYWAGASWGDLTAGSGGYTTWDQMYANDKTLTIDSTTLTLAHTTATGDGLTITGGAATTGSLVQLTQSGSGADITGTSSTWSISSAGAVVATALTMGDDEPITLGASSDAVIQWVGSGNVLDISGATNFDGNMTIEAAHTLTIAGAAGSTKFTITAGDAVLSEGSLSIDDDDDAAALTVVNDTTTTANIVEINADAMVDGFLLHLDSANDASFSAGGYLECLNGTSSVFTIGSQGLLTIAGSASGTSAIIVTAGDVEVTSGDITVTEGSVSITNTANETALTIVGDSVTDGILVDINADGVTTGTILHLDTTKASFAGKYIQCYDGAADDFSVGLDGATIITTEAAATVGLTLTHGGTTGDAMRITCSALTTGDALQIASTAETLAAGELLKITNTEDGDFSTTPKTGNVASITSSCTMKTNSASLDYDTLLISRSDIANQATKTLTSAGSVLKLLHTTTQTAGTSTDSAVVLEAQATESAGGLHTGAVAFINNDCTEAISLLIDAESTTANVVDISATTLTEGKAIDISDLSAITSGKAIHIDASGTTQTTGILVHIDSAATALTGAGRLFLSDHTGATTTSGILNEFKSVAADETVVLQVTADALTSGKVAYLTANALTSGKALDISNLSALTTGKAIHVDADGDTQTDGILVHIDSASTKLTSTGRVFLVDHTGNATVSGVIAEFQTSAADETVLAQFDAAALTSGTIINVVPTALTTGCALKIEGADALTSGDLVSLESDSADTSARALLKMHNNNTAAVGCVPIEIVQDAVISTNFKMILNLAGQIIYVSDGTTPNGNLSGVAGNLCIGADSGKSYYCTGTTNWTAL